MMTSSATPPSLLVRSSSLARPSGLSTDLSKSKNASAANVTFSLVARGGGGGGGGGATGGGAGGGGGGGFGSRSSSQPLIAFAGVKKPCRTQLPKPLMTT